MIITKVALPRRTFLRGLGVAIGLPLLDAMIPALSAGAKAGTPARRLGFIYAPDGMAITSAVDYWKPKVEGATLEMSPILKPLEPYRGRLVVVSGLSQKQAEAMGDGNGDHTRGTATWLNGVHPKWTEGADVRAGITADQIAATELGKDTPLPSIELGLGSQLRGRQLRERLQLRLHEHARVADADDAAPGGDQSAVGVRAPVRRRGHVRPAARTTGEDAQHPRRGHRADASTAADAGRGDRTTVSDYLDTVRELERRIQRADDGAEATLPTLERPMGIPDRFDEHAKLMFDLQCLAFQADITRVFTFMLGRGDQFPELPRDRSFRTASWHVAPWEPAGRHTEIRKGRIPTTPSSSRISWRSCSPRPMATAPCSIMRCSCMAPVSATATSTPTWICRSCWRAVRIS